MRVRDSRHDYHLRLQALEDRLLVMGGRVADMVDDALAAVVESDPVRGAAVIRGDDLVDEDHLEAQQEILTLLALQAPVARDLRLISACLLVGAHLERMGDLCGNIARAAQASREVAGDGPLLAEMQDMGQRAGRSIRRALEAFARRDIAMAGELAALDEPIDRLNRQLFRRLVELAAVNSSQLDWAMHMVLVARYLERLGDHAVDIAHNTVFVVTGESAKASPTAPLA